MFRQQSLAAPLQDTLDEANNDAQHLVLDRMRKRATYVERLEAVFHAIIEHDGQDKNVLTEKRLAEILADPKVKAYFSTLEIDVQESAALFNLLDNGDGMVTLEALTQLQEFVGFCNSMKPRCAFGLNEASARKSSSMASCAARGPPGPSIHLLCIPTSSSWTPSYVL